MRAFDDDGEDNGVPSDGDAGGESRRATELAESVARTPAGAGLAAILESVSVEDVSGFETVEYLKAAYRLVNHYHGMFLKAVLETGVRLPAPDGEVVRAESPGEFGSEEARAALVWSRSRAEGTLGRAYQIFGQTPAVGNALTSGAIDEPRANAFINWTSGLCDEHSARVVDDLLPVAPKVTVSELIDRIKKLAIALDPEWAERRYRESLKERRVEIRQTPEGTADLAGRHLPVDRAKSGADRIHALAMSCKKAGDKRRIDLIRADLYLGMLDGVFQQMSDQQIVNHVLVHPLSDDPTGDHDDGGESGGMPGQSGGRGGDDNSGGSAGGDDNRGGGGSAGDEEHAERGDGSVDVVTSETFAGEASPGVLPAGSAWNVHELRAEMTTLLGLDDHPAELPGVGYIPASVAREHAVRMAPANGGS